MNEQEWLTGLDPRPMLVLLRSTASERKLRLFAAVCEREHRRMQSGSPGDWPDLTEQYADGKVSRADWDARRNTLHGGHRFDEPHSHATDAIEDAATMAGHYESGFGFSPVKRDVFLSYGCDLLREIFGNPFRPVVLDPSWLTSDVLALARGIYEERAFDRMPILADALQDAGCTNDDILTHCRDAKQVHVRGCWVVDLLLGKQ